MVSKLTETTDLPSSLLSGASKRKYHSRERGPVAIGGIGGSGTRVVAQVLADAGFYLGADLNRSLDNLWSALLFNRRSLLVDPKTRFKQIADLFYRRMTEKPEFSQDDLALLNELAGEDRHQHNQQFMNDQKDSFLSNQIGVNDATRWGWKLPPVHIFIERLLELDPTLKYIHLTRNALDMAFSSNQNQLGTWGPVLLNRDVKIDPRDSLSYWCIVHRRVRDVMKSYPNRVIEIEFEKLCQSPKRSVCQIFAFCDVDTCTELVNSSAEQIVIPATSGRYLGCDLQVFNNSDLEYIRSIGIQL